MRFRSLLASSLVALTSLLPAGLPARGAESAATLKIPLQACAYMGDDYIDAPAIAAAGIGISVPTALPAALAAADYVTRRQAGAGAVREVCDLILDAHGLTSGNKLRPKKADLA